jgi:hypothetical protein
MTAKRDLTANLIKAWPTGQAPDLDRAMVDWYVNIRDTGGYRLTDEGFRVLIAVLELQHWQLPVDPKTITKRVLLDLDRKIEFPFYLEKRSRQIVFFGSREAMMATMYGNLIKFLENCG